MSARVAFLLNGPQRSAGALLQHWFQSEGLAVDEYWAYQGEFPADPGSHADYDAVFLSGSPHGAYEDIDFIHRETDFISAAADTGLPMLGVCFGNQILASALCARDTVFRRPTCEVGYKWLATSCAARTDPLTADLGEQFRMFVWHNDEVAADHPDMAVLASTPDCANQIWRFRDMPVWGIQGHPEVTLEAAPTWFGARRARLEADGVDVDDLIERAESATTAKTALRNFARLCRQC